MRLNRLPVLTCLLLALVGGCAATPTDDDGAQRVSDDARSYDKHPDPVVEARHVEAYNLDLGNGVPQDRVKANQLYLQNAYAGDPRSMLNLAINLANGDGIEQDEVEAFAWLDAARFLTQQSRDMKVKWRVRGAYDELKSELSPQQIREGQQRASAFVERIRAGK